MKRTCIVLALICFLGYLAGMEIPLRQAYNLEFSGLSAKFGDGNHLIVWSDTSTGDENVYAQKYAISGNPLWTEPLVVANQIGPEAPRQVISTTDGSCIIVWLQHPPIGLDQTLKAQKFDSQGNSLWAEEGVTICGPSAPWFHCLATPDANGGCHIVYRISENTVLLQRLDAEGNLLHPMGGIPLLSYTNRIDLMDIYPDGEGGFVANLHKQDFGDFDAHLIHVSATGQIVGPNPILATSPFLVPDYRLAKDPTGSWVIYGWDDMDSCVFQMQRIDLAGNLLMDEPLEYNMGNYNRIKVPQVNFYTDGRLVLSWEGHQSTNDYYEFKMVAFDAQNSLDWFAEGAYTEYLLNETYQRHHVSISPGGACRVLCQSRLLAFSPTGQSLTPYGGTLITSATGLFPHVIAEDEGALLFWKEDESMTMSLRIMDLDANAWGNTPFGGESIRSGFRENCAEVEVCSVGDRILATWTDNRMSGNNKRIYYQILDNEDTVLSEGGIPLNPQGTFAETFHQVLEVDQQAAILYNVWDDGVFKAYLQVIDRNGEKLYDGYGVEIFADATEGSIWRTHCSYYNGDFYIAWNRSAGGVGNWHMEILAQRISDGVCLWGPGGMLIRQGTPLAGFYVTGFCGNYLIWTENYQTRVLKLDPQGNPYPGWDPSDCLALDPSLTQRYDLHSAFLTGDDDLILFLGIANGAADNYVAQKFNPQGQMLFAPSGITLFPEHPGADLVQAVQSFSNLGLLFYDGSVLRLQRFRPDGSFVGSTEGIDIAQITGRLYEARMVYYYNGNYNVYMSIDPAPTPNHYQNDLYRQEISSYDGSLVGSLVTVCTAPGSQHEIEAASSGYTSVLVWMDQRARIMSSSQDNESIYADFQQTQGSPTADPQITPPASPISIQTWPNPFRTSLEISLEGCKIQDDAIVEIYNIRGQQLRRIVLEPGSQQIIPWDGKDQSGKACSPGIYLIKAISGDLSSSKKVMLIP